MHIAVPVRRLVCAAAMAALALTAVPALIPAASAAPADFTFSRIAGADRYDTARRVALATFPTGSANAIVASGEDFPDALAGTYLAGRLDAPVLLTPRASLSPAAVAALAELGTTTVTVVGGEAAVSPTVFTALQALPKPGGGTLTVNRIAGVDRYATAAAVVAAGGGSADALATGKTAMLATGADYADALVSGPLAYAGSTGAGLPLLLTTPQTLSAEAAAAITDLGIQHVLIIGGTVAVSPAVEAQVEALGGGTVTTERISGANRYATAILLWDWAEENLGFADTHVDLTRGVGPQGFADALALGPFGGVNGFSTILTPPNASAPEVVAAFQARKNTLVSAIIAGGPAAVAPDITAGYRTTVTGTPPPPLPAVPAAADDVGTVVSGKVLTGASLLANDTVDPTTAIVSPAPAVARPTAKGSVTVAPNGTYSYTPAIGFTGTDSFTYTIANISGSATATVTITVSAAPPLQPPVEQPEKPHHPPIDIIGIPPMAAADAASTTRNTPLYGTTVLANDFVWGAAITSPLTGVPIATAHGTVTMSVNGTYTYVPDEEFIGTETFQYTLTNPAGSANATVTITVVAPQQVPNDAPKAVDDSYTTMQNTPLTIPAPGVLVNDDLQGGSMAGWNYPDLGIVDWEGPFGHWTGGFTFTPPPGFVGTATFAYAVGAEGFDLSFATVTVTVTATPGPQAPAKPDAVNDHYTTPTGVALTVGAPGLLANDTHLDAAINWSTLSQQGGTVVGQPDGSFVYTPKPNFTGSDLFVYILGEEETGDSAVVTIDVTSEGGVVDPDVPIAVDDEVTVTGGSTVTVPTSLLDNDQFVPAQGFGALTVTMTNQNGIARINADGTFEYTPPDPGFVGDDSFGYFLNGPGGYDSAIVTVHVVAGIPGGEGEGPEQGLDAVDDSFLVAVGETINSGPPGLLSNDLYATGTVVVVDEGETFAGGFFEVFSNGSFNYTAPGSANGDDSFPYSIQGPGGGTDTAQVIIDVVVVGE